MGEFRMPSLGAEMDEGKLVEWLVKPGDEVHRGDVVAVVETDKAAIEVEVFEDGVVSDLVVPPGTKVPVGEVLAHLGAPAAAPAAAAPAAAAEPAVTEEPAVPAPVTARAEEPHVTSPLVRHLAEDAHLDLTGIAGSGPAGRITRHDVTAALTAATAPPGGNGRRRMSPYARRLATARGVEVDDLEGSGPGGAVIARDVGTTRTEPPATTQPAAHLEEGAAEEIVETADEKAARRAAAEQRADVMRQAIARAMARSKREIPHYYLGHRIDLDAATRWLAEHNADRRPADRVILAAVLLKAVATALVEFPDMNGFWIDDHHEPSEHVHLGVAISLRTGGLVAPAIHDAETLSVDDLMTALRDLVKRARALRLKSSEMTDPTITVTNLGDQGVDRVMPIIYPPQVAIVGFGRPTDAVVAVGGMVAVRPVVEASLAADHRCSDGHRGGLFLALIDRLLQTPQEL